MLRQAAAEMGIDLTRSYLIGDAVTDVQAGRQVGCQTILVLTGRGIDQLVSAFHFTGGHFLTISRNLKEAADYILGTELGLRKEAELADLTPISNRRW
jgi:D-glycero-D-manno-heptose 1,7-bisphosphate phosphatase